MDLVNACDGYKEESSGGNEGRVRISAVANNTHKNYYLDETHNTSDENGDLIAYHTENRTSCLIFAFVPITNYLIKRILSNTTTLATLSQ